MAESSSRPWCLDARKHARWGWDYVNLSGFSPLFRISSFLAGTSEGVAVLAIVGIGRTREESQQSSILISFANIDPTASFVRHLTDLLWGYIAISYVNKESRDDGGQKCFLFFFYLDGDLQVLLPHSSRCGDDVVVLQQGKMNTRDGKFRRRRRL